MVKIVDIYSIWNQLIKGLNSINTSYTFIKANQNGNMPAYPFGTVNCLTPYVRDKDMIRGTIIRENIQGDSTKVKLNKRETPQMVFSLNCYSNKLQDCLSMLKASQDWLTFTGQQYLQSCGIIIIECSPISDRTSYLETEYQYQWGFDIRCRVEDIVSINVDAIGSVEVTNELNNEKIEIGGN